MPVNKIFYSYINDEPRIKYAQVTDDETGEERLLEPQELIDPEDVDVGDKFAYKVNLLAGKIFKNKDLKD